MSKKIAAMPVPAVARRHRLRLATVGEHGEGQLLGCDVVGVTLTTDGQQVTLTAVLDSDLSIEHWWPEGPPSDDSPAVESMAGRKEIEQ